MKCLEISTTTTLRNKKMKWKILQIRFQPKKFN